MSKRQVIVLWAIALVLVAVLFIAKSTSGDGYQTTTERSRGDTLLEDFDPTEVSQMTVRTGDDTVTLKKSDDGWNVAERGDYPARIASVNEVLRTLAEVEVTQGIEADPSFDPRFGMDPDSDEDQPTLVTLSDGSGSELAALTFGKNIEAAGNPMSPFGGGSTGRFVRNQADDSGVYVTNELFPTLAADPSAWLDDTFLRIEKIQSVAVSEPGQPDTTAWKLVREDETGDFSLAEPEPGRQLDTAAVNPIKNVFSYPRFNDVVAGEAPWQDDQQRRAVIETFEGFTYTVHFGPAEPAEPEEGDVAPQPSYLMTVEVSAELPAERKAEEGESEEDAGIKQEAFEARKKTLEEKLAAETKLEGRTFEISKTTVDALLKSRAELIQSETPVTPPQQPLSGGLLPGTNNAPGMPANRPRAQAVTPPIAIPPLPDPPEAEAAPPVDEAPEEEPAPEEPETPEEPEEPEQLETPEQPEAPEESEGSDEPEQPEARESQE